MCKRPVCVLKCFGGNPSRKGQGFNQPQSLHRYWHINVIYLNIADTFYFMTSILDGYSRAIVHREIHEKMGQVDIEAIVQRAREHFPDEMPRIITDNGPQFISKDFKQFVRMCNMTLCAPRRTIHRATEKSNDTIQP